jgi:hypothetical protein
MMAKALFGHLGGTDPRTAAELAALRRRVRELQDEVDALREQAEHHTLARLDGELSVDALTVIAVEPVTV